MSRKRQPIRAKDAVKHRQLERKSDVKASELRRDLLDSGLFELAVTMAVTGREVFISPDGELVKGDALSVNERMRLINKLIDRAVPVARTSVKVETSNEESDYVKLALEEAKQQELIEAQENAEEEKLLEE